MQQLQKNAVSSPRIAVAGCGYWGVNLVRNFAGLGALAAVIDPRPGVAAEFSAKYQVAARDWSEALADPAIDAVAIAAPAVITQNCVWLGNWEADDCARQFVIRRMQVRSWPGLGHQSEAMGSIAFGGHGCGT